VFFHRRLPSSESKSENLLNRHSAVVAMLALYALPIAYLLYTIASGFLVYLQTRVPGPWVSNFTSLILKYHEFNKNRRLWIHSLHQIYGPVVRLAPNEVSFANLEGMKEIYQSGGSGYDKTEFYDLFRQYGHRTMFTTPDRHEHAQRKKLFAERYAMTNIVRPSMIEGIQKRARSVIDQCQASVGSYLDVYVTLHCYALDGASHFLFNPGGTDSLNDPEDLKLMRELSYHDSLRQRYIKHYLPALNRLMMAIFKPKSVPLSEAYVRERATAPNAAETSLIQKLQSKSTALTSIQMAAECMDHMAAGIDTTGDGLCFLMHELSLPRSRAIQSRLRDELITNPTARLDELPYLDAVVKEGLRRFSPIPMSLPRHVPGPQGRSICGYHLPAGSIVSCQPFSLHLLNSSTWGTGMEDPVNFVPERWLDQKRSLEMNRLFFAFGAGGRGCIGRNLALVEMKTLLKEVYSRYSTRVAEEMRGDMTIDDQIIASRPKDQTCLLVFEPI
jgi:cytochrome P450